MEEHRPVPDDDVQDTEEGEDLVGPEDVEDALFEYLFGPEHGSTASRGSGDMALSKARGSR